MNVEDNLHIVKEVIERYVKQEHVQSFLKFRTNVDNLISVGTIGLIKAINKNDTDLAKSVENELDFYLDKLGGIV